MSEPLARKLKQARAESGLSQSQAAKAWEIPLKTLQQWEQNRATPRGLALKALETLLNGVLSGGRK